MRILNSVCYVCYMYIHCMKFTDIVSLRDLSICQYHSTDVMINQRKDGINDVTIDLYFFNTLTHFTVHTDKTKHACAVTSFPFHWFT